MADGVAITAGSGTNIFTDDLGASGHAQRIKLIHGVDGTNDGDVAKSNPLPTYNYGRSSTVSVTPTVSTTPAYTAKDVAGGKMTFSSALDSTTLSGILDSIVIRCKSVQTTGFKLALFSDDPSNSTWTDNSIAAINASDIPFLLGVWTLGAPESDLGTVTLYELDGIGARITGSSATIYGVLTVTATPTFASTTDITVELRITRD